jgi:hypothetical protein
MIIHRSNYPSKKYIFGRGLVINNNKRYVHGKGFLDSIIPMATSILSNPQILNAGKDIVTSGINIGKTIKDGISIAKPSKLDNKSIMQLIDDIKGIHVGKGFSKI